MWSIYKTPEIPPTAEELAALNERNKGMPPAIVQFLLTILTSVIAYIVLALLLIPTIFYRKLFRKFLNYARAHSFLKVLFAQNIEILDAIVDMPKVMWQLALIYLFQWYALFCYWQNSSKSVALSVWHTTPKQNAELYEKAVAGPGL